MNKSTLTPTQRQAVEFLDGPVLIAAGAGSGKTYTLTQRVAAALLPGSAADGGAYLQSIDQVLITTFTNKAAGEIKDRIRSTLRAEGLFDEALKVDGAWISTIHSMCERILREHALELGLDPAFELQLGPACDAALQQAIEQVLDRIAIEGANSPSAALLDEYGVNGVGSMVAQVLSRASTLVEGLDAFEFGPQPRPIEQQLRALVEELELLQETGGAATKEHAARMIGDITEWLGGSKSRASAEELLAGIKSGSVSGKAAANAKSLIKELHVEFALAQTYDLGRQLITLAREANSLYLAQLESQGFLDTSGIIRTTLQAFDAHPEIAAQYTQRFKLIMVDEFQDTSQLQIRMIERIAGPEKRHLCTVGDSQQSIYRFQGADVEVYLQHKADMAASGAQNYSLGENFRSHGDILAFVRKVCGQPGFFPESFLDLTASTQGRGFLANTPRVELALTTCPQKGAGGIEAARLMEAQLIAQRFAQLRDAGHKPGDMVVLMGVTSAAPLYMKALNEVGLSCVFTGGSKFFGSIHVQTCLSLLVALANPFNTEALLDVLASELLPVSTTDLLQLATKQDSENPLPKRRDLAWTLVHAAERPAQVSQLARHALAVFDRAWKRVGSAAPAQVLRQVLVESGWLGRLENEGPEGLAKAADVLKFVSIVEEEQDHPGYNMARTASAMLARASGHDKAGALSLEGSNAVRITTIHSAKGLAFPIVAVTECFGAPRGGAAPAMCTSTGRAFCALKPKGTRLDLPAVEDGAQLGKATSLAQHLALIESINRERDEAERRRLFYVAITRPSDYLMVSLTHKETKNGYTGLSAWLLGGLMPGQDDFPAASGTIDYGGSEPLLFTRQSVELDELDDAEGSGTPEAGLGAEADSPAAAERQVPVPRLEAVKPLPTRAAGLPERERFFSYSMLAHEAAPGGSKAAGSAGGGAAAGAAQESAAGAAAPTSATAPATASSVPASSGTSAPAPEQGEARARAAEPDLASYPDSPFSTSPEPDADRATQFGSCLHRACEWLALQSSQPTNDEIDQALERFAASYGVRNTARLRVAFNTWLRSKVRAHTLTYRSRQPEVPFFTCIGERVMEGEIDLLCSNDAPDAHTGALVVDYKTGGWEDETPEQVHAKHLLQAQCYALAVLQAGYESVELHFVRVEQADPADPDQPQVASYRFDKSEQSNLKDALTEHFA